LGDCAWNAVYKIRPGVLNVYISSIRRQELSGFEENDDHGRLLDELASKQDHLARK